MDASVTQLTGYLAHLPPRPRHTLTDPLAGTAAPGVAFSGQLRVTGLVWRFGALLGTHTLESGLLFASWGFIGSGALSGRLDAGWLAGWAVCLASTVPLRIATRWLQGVIAVGFGGLLKQRLLAGAMMIDADGMRRKGAGELLSEVLEAEGIERLGSSGLQAVLASLELGLVPFIFALGAAARAEILLLAVWVILTLILSTKNLRQRVEWTKLRRRLTHQLVENMTAHRTRLAQQPPAEWHRVEDRMSEHYAELSESLDRSTARLEALARGYVIASLALLAPSFLAGGGTPGAQAVTLGALLFAGAAFERWGFGLVRTSAAWIAWRSVQPMFAAASRPTNQGVAAALPSGANSLLQVQDVSFAHEGRCEFVLKDCTLTIRSGDLLLLEGPSGGGKSTFAALLAGLRRPAAGIILAGGLDRQTLGDQAWRGRVALAPQYHENHILSAPLGFNLLLGRSYPHSPQDLGEARALCHELGLGPLLERMPGGLDQMVGETGWQLSQGERSRVFLARALLQRADVVVLDESLAALDPETLRQCLECVIRRAKALLVIAHP
jgi:ATP-binding cassette subfamily B protein